MLKHLKFIKGMYSHRKSAFQPDLRVWEFVFQMLTSAYLSWRWLDAKFEFWKPQYWAGLSQYSSLSELGVRAKLASDRTQELYGAEITQRLHQKYQKEYQESKESDRA